MKKYLLGILLLVIATFLLLFGKTLFQEGNPLPITYAVVKMTIKGDSFAQLDSNRYLVRSNKSDTQKLKEFLKKNEITFVDQMGAALFFETKNKERITAESRMFTSYFEVWEFDTALVIPYRQANVRL